MRTVSVRTRLLVIGGLAAGWTVGLLAQRSIVEATGYFDVSPGLLVFGCVLCFLAGGAAHVLAPAHRRIRTGVVAGIAMAGAIIGGYLLLAFVYDGFAIEESGETWWTLLLEAWFWIGVPLVASGTLGAAGFLVVQALERLTRRRPPGPVSHQGT
jgi:MFS family permease